MDDAQRNWALEQARSFYQWPRLPAIRTLEPLDCAYSSVSRIEIECERERRVLYLKHIKLVDIDGAEAARRVTVEFRTLSELSDHFRPHAAWRVPRPVAVDPAERMLLTEQVPGVVLKDLIGRSAKRTAFGYGHEVMEEYCAMSGRWLRQFQSFTAQAEGSFNHEGLREYCAQRLDTLVLDKDSGIDAAFKRRFLDYLQRAQESLGARPDRIVGRHNDFSPHNILVEGERLSVIDFGFFDHDSYLYDVGKFWFQLECMKASPLFSARTIERLQTSFLSGYGGSVDTGDPAFQLVVGRYFLTRLATMRKEGMRRGPRRWIDQRSYGLCLAWLAARCQPA